MRRLLPLFAALIVGAWSGSSSSWAYPFWAQQNYGPTRSHRQNCLRQLPPGQEAHRNRAASVGAADTVFKAREDPL